MGGHRSHRGDAVKFVLREDGFLTEKATTRRRQDSSSSAGALGGENRPRMRRLTPIAAYAAALAGYTAVIIASDQLGAAGGLNGEAFTLAISRVTEIGIGIVSAGIVLAETDLGNARRQLATLLANADQAPARVPLPSAAGSGSGSGAA